MKQRNINIAICEDNEEFAEIIKKTIEIIFTSEEFQSSSFELNYFLSGEELIKSEKQYDIIIQDLVLGTGKMHGYDVIRKIRKKYNIQPTVIILTSLADQGEGVFSDGVNAESFVVKRVDDTSRLETVLFKFIWNSIFSRGLNIKARLIGDVYIYFNEIRYIGKNGNDTKVNLAGGVDYDTEKTLDWWMENLPDSQFISPHKENIINLDFFDEISEKTNEIILKGSVVFESIKIAARRKTKISKEIMKYEKEKMRRTII